jgi:hypothetical protein
MSIIVQNRTFALDTKASPVLAPRHAYLVTNIPREEFLRAQKKHIPFLTSVVKDKRRLMAFTNLDTYCKFATIAGIATPVYTSLGFSPDVVEEIARGMRVEPLYIVDTSAEKIEVSVVNQKN